MGFKYCLLIGIILIIGAIGVIKNINDDINTENQVNILVKQMAVVNHQLIILNKKLGLK